MSIVLITGTVPGRWWYPTRHALQLPPLEWPVSNKSELVWHAYVPIERGQAQADIAQEGPPAGYAFDAIDPSAVPNTAVVARYPQALRLAIFEDPATALAMAFSSGTELELDSWIENWCVSARGILACMQTDTSEVLIIEAAELRDAPLALRAALAERGVNATFDEGDRESPEWASSMPDPLATALAMITVDDHDSARELLEELRASSTQLTPSKALPFADAGNSQTWIQASVARLRTLAALEQARQEVPTREQLRAELEAAMVERNAIATRCAALETSLAKERREANLISLVLEQQRQEMRHATESAQGMREAEAQLEAERELSTRLRNMLDSSQHNRDELEQSLAEAQRQLSANAHDRQLATAKALEDARRLEAANARLDAAKAENAMLAAQLRQMREEIDTLAAAQARHREQRARALAYDQCSVEGLQIEHERATPPHKELSFRAERIVVGNRDLRGVSMRLVDHNGHPGLVIFQQPAEEQVFSNWVEHGREDNRPFTLLVPSDSRCRPLLDRMSTAEATLLDQILAAMRNSILQSDLARAAQWVHLNNRVEAALEELPPRFRFSDSVIARAEESGSDTFDVVIENTRYRRRQFSQLVLQWCTRRDQQRLELRADIDARPPLCSWPTGDIGALGKTLQLPVGAPLRQGSTLATWQQVLPGDKEFILAMLASWPGIVHSALTKAQDLGAVRDQLRASADSIARRAAGLTRRPERTAARLVARMQQQLGTTRHPHKQ